MSVTPADTPQSRPGRGKMYKDVIGPRLKPVLTAVLTLFALLSINAIYLSAVSLLEFFTGRALQDTFFQYMFLAHVVLGLLFVVPALIYAAGHYRRAHRRPNRRAVRAGQGILFAGVVLLLSGLVLTRGLPGIALTDGQVRATAYWLHVAAPLLVVWLFVLHRLAGKAIRWRRGGAVAGLASLLALVGVGVIWQSQSTSLPQASEQYFSPSLARTANAELIPAELLMTDQYCAECHEDTHAQWEFSAHHLASFNNPAYLFSVRQTRQKMLARDGSVQGARFCAGCHDPVPFFSGAFNDPDFDDVADPTSQAGITCVACHAIEHINSPRGNADYVIGAPEYYPFTFSESATLRWVNRFLVKANPSFHKRTLLKSLHGEPEFCATCHKVHLPEALNQYRWLRGQNHYDSFLLSGVSGSSVSSFYYPKQAEAGCNGCHMPRVASNDFAASVEPGESEPAIHNHLFASGNTALGSLLDHPDRIFEQHREMVEGSVSIDLFGLREGSIDGPQLAPLSSITDPLQRGRDYLLEVVLSTQGMGHLFTQGTADSNQIWLEVSVLHNGEPIAVSGGMNSQGEVDPAAHFVNAFVLDRDGYRIAERNAEDIFTTLYNHQIPPGASDVVFYRFNIPPSLLGEISFEARLRYRKFDTQYYRRFTDSPGAANPLPIIDIAAASAMRGVGDPSTWRRWNNYGIGLLRKPESGALRQAEAAFQEVATLPGETATGHGLLNLARVYLREGRLAEAERTLQQAASENLAFPWVHGWLTAELNLQNGFIEQAIDTLEQLATTPFAAARSAGMDFSRDYRLWEKLGGAYYTLSRALAAGPDRDAALASARDAYRRVLDADPERAGSHYGLSRVLLALGNQSEAEHHAQMHDRYRVDDNAADRAIAAARARYPAAAVAAEPVAVYPLEIALDLIATDD
ncbi:MAG: multiheme c-type cytochrome [Pseudomonadota bacterium]